MSTALVVLMVAGVLNACCATINAALDRWIAALLGAAMALLCFTVALANLA